MFNYRISTRNLICYNMAMKGKKEVNLSKTIVNFEEFAVRRIWDDDNEKWLFSVVDVIVVLTNSPRPRKY